MAAGIGIVDTRYGKLKGVSKQGYTFFRGVPYARPPVGELRWRRPLPPVPWDGTREAREFSAMAVQQTHNPDSFYGKEFFSDGDYYPPKSEDCLYLNIWTPARAASEWLPVALWIHGGAFVAGFGSEMEFDGGAFCARDVILVTFNYRLGALGFLAHEWLRAESAAGGGGGYCGNYGLFDQLAALRWVNENIAAFGGDPSRVTVFGQSAGSMSVQALLASQLTKGLIGGAIMQSGGGYKLENARDISPDSAFALGAELADICGAPSLAALREVPAQDIYRAADRVVRSRQAKSKAAGQAARFAPIIDGCLLTKPMDAAFGDGDHPDIPYMIGTCQNDFGITREALARGEKNRLYDGSVRWALLGEKLGRRPGYAYYFTREPLGDDAGAFHSSELWYVFGTLSRSWRPKTPEDYALSRRVTDYWCNFVKTGDPNGGELARWAACSEKNGGYVHVLGV